MSRGLFVGKFAPFHAGHQYVVETALEEIETLTVVIYDAPEVTQVPLPVRADWIRDLYPAVEVLEAWCGPSEVGYEPRLKAAHERYLTERLGDREITHVYSSEPYGNHLSQAFDAVDRRVDPDRSTVPISGTAIREATYENRAYVQPRVYRDLVTNVVFLGGPSTGKTTLVRRLAEEYDTDWMPEYGREYWANNQVDRRLSQSQLVDLAAEHLEREDECLTRARKYLFTDTNAITTYAFSKYYHDTAPPELLVMARACRSRYDLTIVCDTDIPFDDTEDRSGPASRERLHRQTLAFLDRHRIPYVVVSGDLESRVQRVRRLLSDFEPFRSRVDPAARE